MAQYAIDPASVTLAEFTLRHGATTSFSVVDDGGTPAIQLVPSTTACFLSYDPVPATADLEIVTKVRLSNNDSGNGALAAARMQTAALTVYGSGIRNSDIVTLVDYVNGSVSGLGQHVTAGPTTAYKWQRFSVVGTSLRQKTWVGTPADEPLPYDLETTNGDISAAGLVGIGARENQNTSNYYAWIGVGTNGDTAPTAPVSAGSTRTTSESASGADTWAAICAAAASTSNAAVGSDSFSVIASISASIISAAQASDQTGDSPAASVSLDSAATGSDSVDALASAAAALSAGAAAGESWSVQAQVTANLLSAAVGNDEIKRQTDVAVNAALLEGSIASGQFLAAITSIASLSDGATTADAYIAVVAQLAGIASGAIASDTFKVDFGFRSAIQSGAISGATWVILAALSAELYDTVTASDLMSARATVSVGIVSAAVASDRFAIVNAGIRYLVMGAITLRSALNYSVSTKPALNQTVTIKPGH